MNCFTGFVVVAFGAVLSNAPILHSAELPDSWLPDWSHPPVQCRPLQIVHGVPAQQATPEAMAKLKDLGLGGIVCNVAFGEYLRSEANWRALEQAVKSCQEVGLRVWIYDEDGYPSGAAGGLVLEGHPEFEALALAYDPSQSDPFILRPAYEHTHASNNFYAARRFPNLIDDAAVERFIEVTHEAYYKRLEPYFGTTIEALFTDEPSLMPTNIGPLPDDVREKVRVVDPLDPNIKPLPSVPWMKDLPQLYRDRYDQDLLAVRKSLFEGDTESDREIRRRYWALISDLFAQRYYGKIQKWAKAHKVASSGHILWEETLVHHPALEGNTLKVLGRMDIPGMDLLNSWPEVAIHHGWITAGLPASAALFNGGRKVMTEVSDFSQTLGGQDPASVVDMCAVAAWQAAFGVTEFTLYYDRNRRTPAQYNTYGTFVGRLNALLREAQPTPRVLLYYPITEAWSEYKPVAEKLTPETQSTKFRRVAESFEDLGRRLTRAQISFALADREILERAVVEGNQLRIGDHLFGAVVLPAETSLPSAHIQKFATTGCVLREATGRKLDLSPLNDQYTSGLLNAPADKLVVGRFTREGRELVLVVNVGTEPLNRTISAPEAAKWVVADPTNGTIESVQTEGPNGIATSLPPKATRILIGPATKGDGQI